VHCLRICLEGDILTLLTPYNHIDEGYQVVRVEEVHLTETAILNSWLGQIYGFTLSDDVMIGWKLCEFNS